MQERKFLIVNKHLIQSVIIKHPFTGWVLQKLKLCYLQIRIEPMFHSFCGLCFLLLVPRPKHFGLWRGLLIVSIFLSHGQCIAVRSSKSTTSFSNHFLTGTPFYLAIAAADMTIVKDLFFSTVCKLFRPNLSSKPSGTAVSLPLLDISSIWRANYVEAFESQYS